MGQKNLDDAQLTDPFPDRDRVGSEAYERAGLDRWEMIFVGLLYGATAVFACWSLDWKFGVDQSIYAWVGDVIVDGGVPYLDAFEIKGPIVHYMFALAQALFGHNQWGIRVLDLLIVSIGAVTCFKLGCRIHSGFAGHIAASIFVFLSYKKGFWFSAQPDTWASIAIALLIYRSVSRGDKGRWTYPAFQALLLLILIMQKPAYGVFVAIPLAHDLWPHSEGGPRWQPVLQFALWFAGLTSIAVVYFAYNGALAALWEIQFDFVVNTHLGAPYLGGPVEVFSKIDDRMSKFFPIWLLLPGTLLLWTVPRRLSLTILAWMGLGIAFIVLQNKYFLYHFLLLSSVFSLLLALPIAVLGRTLVSQISWGPSRLRASLALAFSMIFVTPVIRNVEFAHWMDLLIRQDPDHPTDTTYGNGVNYNYLPRKQVAEYLIPRLAEEDQLAVWSYDSLIYYLSDRNPPGRFGSNYPIIGEIHRAESKRHRNEYMLGLFRVSPKFIVVAMDDKNQLMSHSSAGYLPWFHGLEVYLRRFYTLKTNIGPFGVYQRLERAKNSQHPGRFP